MIDSDNTWARHTVRNFLWRMLMQCAREYPAHAEELMGWMP